MENLLKLNLLKVADTKKPDETALGNKIDFKSKENEELNAQFFINHELDNTIKNKESLETIVTNNQGIKKNKVSTSSEQELEETFLIDNNLKINQDDLNKNLYDNEIYKERILASKKNSQNNKNKDIQDINFKEYKNDKLKKNIFFNANKENEKKDINNPNNLNTLNNWSLNQIFSKIKEKNKSKIKSFFQNYINYSAQKYGKNNFKKEKIASLSKLDNSYIVNKSSINIEEIDPKVSETINLGSKKTNINNDMNFREQNNISENFIKDKNEKNFDILKENSINSFDRLKNILDIKSNDMQQRFYQILENNIKVNNNKFEIQLRPENLGKIYITLEMSGQNIDININSDNINTIQSLTENNGNLQKMLQSHGMNLNSFNFNGHNNKNKDKANKNIDEVANDSFSTEKEKNSIKESEDMSNKLVYVKA